MIQAVIFDLDGTLVQTERLKALSYARAIAELAPGRASEAEVMAVFAQVVGLARREVAMALMDRFGLHDAARARMAGFGVNTPWQAFVQVRLRYYHELLADPRLLREYQWPHTMTLLRQVRAQGCRVALATMSQWAEVCRVLEALQLERAFDFVATRDDVSLPKPDPEIYTLVASELRVVPDACLVIEDSPAGVAAAVRAGMWVVAVSTPFTRARLHECDLLDPRWIVDDPARLTAVVATLFAEQRKPV